MPNEQGFCGDSEYIYNIYSVGENVYKTNLPVTRPSHRYSCVSRVASSISLPLQYGKTAAVMVTAEIVAMHRSAFEADVFVRMHGHIYSRICGDIYMQ